MSQLPPWGMFAAVHRKKDGGIIYEHIRCSQQIHAGDKFVWVETHKRDFTIHLSKTSADISGMYLYGNDAFSQGIPVSGMRGKTWVTSVSFSAWQEADNGTVFFKIEGHSETVIIAWFSQQPTPEGLESLFQTA